MPQILTARQLHTSDEIIPDAVVEIDDAGHIVSVHSDPGIRSEDTLTAAFFDIHTHGAVNCDVMNATPQGLRTVNHFLATKGVSHYLPTTVTAPLDQTLRALEALADAIEAPPEPHHATPVGIHLEGPFLSHLKRGVHPAAELQPPSIELFERFHQSARGHIRLVTIAPETPGALDLIRYCARLGIRTSLGHTNATAPEAAAAIEAGATSATHTFNAMRPLNHRDPGILGAVLDDQRLFAELICDGIHVAPELIRLWLKMKGIDRAILITDSISATGMPDGTYKLGNLEVTVANNRCLLSGTDTLAGSVLTLDQAVANLQQFTSAPLAHAVRLASHNPASLLGLSGTIANIAPGQPANLNRFDPSGRLIATCIGGSSV